MQITTRSPFRSTTLIFSCFAGALLFSCQDNPDLPNFDEAAWIADFNGCSKTRIAMLKELKPSLNMIKGLNQEEVVALLGKPEINRLYKRSQKFFIYQISPGKNCKTSYSSDEQEFTLNIRFTAMGLAKEVLVYNE